MNKKRLFFLISIVGIIVTSLGLWLYNENQKNTSPSTDEPLAATTEHQNKNILSATLLPHTNTIRYIKQDLNTKEGTIWDLDYTTNTEKEISDITISNVILDDQFSGIKGIVWSPDGSSVLLYIENNSSLPEKQSLFHQKDMPNGSRSYYLFDITNRTVKKLSENIFSPTWSPDGKKIAYAWRGRTLNISDPDGSNFELVWDISKEVKFKDLEFSTLSWGSTNTIVISLINNPQTLGGVPIEFAFGPIYSINISSKRLRLLFDKANTPVLAPNGNYVVVRSVDNQDKPILLIWKEENGQQITRTPFSPNFSNLITSDLIRWSPDSKIVYGIKSSVNTQPQQFFSIDQNNKVQTQPLTKLSFPIRQLFLGNENRVLYLVGENQIKTFDLSQNVFESTSIKIINEGPIKGSKLELSQIVAGKQTYNIILYLDKNFKTQEEANAELANPTASAIIEKNVNSIYEDIKRQNLNYYADLVDKIIFIQKDGKNIDDLPEK